MTLDRTRQRLKSLARSAKKRARPDTPAKSAEAILRAQQEASLDGTLVVDLFGNVITYNRRFLEIWQIPPDIAKSADDQTLLGYAFSLVREPEAFRQNVEWLYANPYEVRIGEEIPLTDGRILRRASVPVVGNDGSLLGRAWHFQDVTGTKNAEQLQSALFRISELSRSASDLDDLFLKIHAIVGELMDATNFYIAIYDETTNLLSFPYFVDEYDPAPPPMPPGRGLTGYVLRTGRALLATPENFEELAAAGEVESIGAASVDWLGVPLTSGDRVLGVLGVQTYDPGVRYTQKHLEILVFVSHHVASAIEDKMKEDALRERENTYRQMFENNTAVKLVLDPETGIIVDANGAASAFYGWSKAELQRMHIWDINLMARPDIERELELAASREQTYFEFKHRLRNGEVRDVEIHSGPVMIHGRKVLYSIITDVTSRKRAEELLRTQSAAIQTSMDGIAIIGRAGVLTYSNEAYARLFGYRDSVDIQGIAWSRLLDEESRQDFLTTVAAALKQKKSWRGRMAGERRDGTTFPLEISLAVLESGEVVCIAHDITERSYAEEQIKHLAYHDALTGLPNRLLFKDRLSVEIMHAQREKEMLAVLFLDLDRFKVINDSLGHNMGDLLLQSVASRIQAQLRVSDTVARLGGDEFTMLLPNLVEIDDASKLALKIVEAMRRPFLINGRELFITTSMGFAIYPIDGVDAETLIKNADTAMYQAKERGRDNFQIFNAAINAQAIHRLAIENGLRRAVANNEFIIHYQPIYHFATGRIYGVEALVRWQHPDLGIIYPTHFIPLAESGGVMPAIGAWVLETACRQLRSWLDRGFDLNLAVNISATQLQQGDLVDTVMNVLLRTGLEPQRLELEITESMAMQNPETSIIALNELKKRGVRISLDDFGTGHSSLSYLKRFPIDTLKIDQSFVRDLTNDTDTAAIIVAIIAMAYSLKLNVIAEGVEQEQQRSFLTEHGCEHMQGFLFERPVPAEQIERLLENPAGPALQQDGR